jgi:hypothetical protein
MLAAVYVNSGEFDRAFQNLKKAAEIHDTWILWIAVDPQFDALRDDEHYQEILKLTNHPLAAK